MDESVPGNFGAAARALGVTLDAAQIDKLKGFVALLLETNRHTNLTAVRDWDGAWSRHVLDSLSICGLLPAEPGQRIVDVGAGGGLPGLVLAIARPELAFTLIDATEKKVRHMERFAASLGLSNVTALHGRAEELASGEHTSRGQHRELYDVAVARALAPMPVLLELVTPFLRVGGVLLAIKGERAIEELQQASAALKALRCELERTGRTPTGTIVTVRKRGSTPRRYPRRAGEPKRNPLR